MEILLEMQVNDCVTCLFMERYYPNSGNGSDFVCTKANYKVVAENVLYEDEPNVGIPHWCPLKS